MVEQWVHNSSQDNQVNEIKLVLSFWRNEFCFVLFFGDLALKCLVLLSVNIKESNPAEGEVEKLTEAKASRCRQNLSRHVLKFTPGFFKNNTNKSSPLFFLLKLSDLSFISFPT